MQQHARHARSDVVDAATAILDNYGIADLTMRRLARELGVTPGALYWHFANKQQLLGAVADRVLAPADTEVSVHDWRDRIRTLGTALRDALLSHTDGAELVSTSFAAGQSGALARIVTLLAAAAADAGVAGQDAELAARTVVHYVLGFTADEQSRLQWDAAGALPEDGPDQQPVAAVDHDRRFAFGRTLLIDGLGVHHRTARSAATSGR